MNYIFIPVDSSFRLAARHVGEVRRETRCASCVLIAGDPFSVCNKFTKEKKQDGLYWVVTECSGYCEEIRTSQDASSNTLMSLDANNEIGNK